jgi:hypothetical protein
LGISGLWDCGLIEEWGLEILRVEDAINAQSQLFNPQSIRRPITNPQSIRRPPITNPQSIRNPPITNQQ